MNQSRGALRTRTCTDGLGDRGVGAFVTGMLLMPGDVDVRSRSASTPKRSEVITVTVTTLASLVLGGVIGRWMFRHVTGVVLGIVGGLLGSVIPLAIGSFTLERFQRRARETND
jgi:preprotein translocase subunit Sss1